MTKSDVSGCENCRYVAVNWIFFSRFCCYFPYIYSSFSSFRFLCASSVAFHLRSPIGVRLKLHNSIWWQSAVRSNRIEFAAALALEQKCATECEWHRWWRAAATRCRRREIFPQKSKTMGNKNKEEFIAFKNAFDVSRLASSRHCHSQWQHGSRIDVRKMYMALNILFKHFPSTFHVRALLHLEAELSLSSCCFYVIRLLCLHTFMWHKNWLDVLYGCCMLTQRSGNDMWSIWYVWVRARCPVSIVICGTITRILRERAHNAAPCVHAISASAAINRFFK